MKNCDRGLENAARGHSFLLYGSILSRKITYLFFSKLSNEKKKTHASVSVTVVRDSKIRL